TDINGSETLTNRRHLRAFKCDFIPLDRFDRRFGYRCTELFLCLGTENVSFPFNIDPRSLDDPDGFRDDLRSDPVARYQCDRVFHKLLIPLYYPIIELTTATIRGQY